MYHILTQFEGSIQRTTVYLTRYENNIAFIQQRKEGSISSWTTFDLCLIPKNFMDFVTTLSNITEEEDFISNSTLSETEVTFQHIPNPLTSDTGSVPMDIKKNFAQLRFRKYAPLQEPRRTFRCFRRFGKSVKKARIMQN